MEKKIAIFKNFAEADKADRDYYHSLTPEERLSILEILRKRYETTHYDGIQQGFRRVFKIVKQK